MEPQLQRRVQRYGWDKASDHYERYWREQLAPAQERMLHLAELRPGQRVLDIACGTGLVTLPAARAVQPGGEVIGTDLSEQMVVGAAAEARRLNVDNARFERMDAEELRLPDASFDAALCGLGLMYVPDPLQAAREMYRVLRWDGVAVAAVWGQRDRCGWAEIFPIVDSRVESDVCPLFFQLGTGDALRYALEAANFTDVIVDRITTTLHYPSAEEAIGAAFVGGPVALAYSRFDGTTREAAHAEYLASIANYRHSSGYDIPGEFVIARGVKRQ